MSDINARLWQVIRLDENGHRYRIGHCTTRADAQRLMGRLELGTPTRPVDAGHYLVERVEEGTDAPRP
ncbi:SPOR domain-containing protein [Streptomyces spiramenti]|uniref:SPOR domain-containing protein n=1 Tax=Streptomyces spiramenti TaxID=2720606 RepID=A0ABX1ANE2_9ACTN|nr:SPOR domain-containing protein [Streptomyces spiramenti]NJP67196.1 SPOR domain-containing protein [Streptomyces spiramenti]